MCQCDTAEPRAAFFDFPGCNFILFSLVLISAPDFEQYDVIRNSDSQKGVDEEAGPVIVITTNAATPMLLSTTGEIESLPNV